MSKHLPETAESSWIPPELALPDSVAEIERGREPQKRQGELFDSSTMSRLRAIKAAEVRP